MGCLDFTFTVNKFGKTDVIELKPGGQECTVTKENRAEYAELLLKHHIFTSTQPQLDHFLRGLHDVIPLGLLSVFNFREIELLICGLPEIDVNDWFSNTIYKGFYQRDGARNQ